MNKQIATLMGTMLIATAATSANAATIKIDDFSDFGVSGGDVGFEANTAANVFAANSSNTSGGITTEESTAFKFSGSAPSSQTFNWAITSGVGPTREMTYTVVNGGTSFLMQHVYDGSGTLDSKFGMSSGNNNTDMFTLTYDNLGSADFSTQDAFLLSIVTDHFGNNGASNPQDISVSVTDGLGNTATVTNSLTSNPVDFTPNVVYNMYLAYADLTGDVVDFTDIESLTLSYEGDKGHDMELNFFAVSNIPVPAPGALGLMSLGIAGLLWRRRK